MTAVSRGRVWKQGRQWVYAVTVDGAVILTDDCRDYSQIQRACRLGVYAVERIFSAGYRLDPPNWRGCLAGVQED